MSQPGDASEDTKHFLQHAAESWTIHHHQARKRLNILISRYYHNLCRPLLSGFNCWVDEFRAPDPPPHPLTSAPDDVQDYCIDVFNLENPSPSLSDAEGQRDDDGSSDTGSFDNELASTAGTRPEEAEKQKPRGTADRHGLRVPSWKGAAECLSRNLGSQRNHYFPFSVCDDRMVTLNTRRGSGAGPSEDQQ